MGQPMKKYVGNLSRVTSTRWDALLRFIAVQWSLKVTHEFWKESLVKLINASLIPSEVVLSNVNASAMASNARVGLMEG